ncbi:Mis12 protein-domain-containing protein [Fomitopsis serialis]|uniref:Mis12 protein-domain-containing protein n=1 Tax=Fomitopsis serialis TaxID=139415 RepID=UPI00200833C1|nr:Mis12 protein-domain-containing protein [Neoantrodia serialis]KAH9932348.1 Mis12 protein-domain-containing protein [Neoantrodia serialis]
MSAPPPPTVPSVLLPELIGFVPQFLLDDVINSANEATQQAVDAMEAFLERRDAVRTDTTDAWKSAEELEKGLNAFQTLLESHVDIAFDFFEAWSLRNIFAIPADLPIVAPHQKGLNLDEPEEKETELLQEIKDLRKQLQAQRKLRRLYTHAVRASAVQLAHSKSRLERLSFLRAPQLQTLLSLSTEFQSMYDSVSALPPPDPAFTAPEQAGPSEPGKRPWETSKTGYINWAVEQLMLRAKEKVRGKVALARGVPQWVQSRPLHTGRECGGRQGCLRADGWERGIGKSRRSAESRGANGCPVM